MDTEYGQALDCTEKCAGAGHMTACNKPGRGEYGTLSPAVHIIQQSKQTIDEDEFADKVQAFLQ